MYSDAVQDTEEKIAELSHNLSDSIIAYFKKNGMGVRKVDDGDELVEIFIGSDDGVKRIQSKVTTHIALADFSHGKGKASFMLRNENTGNDIIRNLPEKDTIGKLIDIIKKAENKGFWKYGR